MKTAKLNKTKPPKNREFLGLVNTKQDCYWDFFWWARKEDGVPKGCYIDRQYFDMPDIAGWIEVPVVEEQE